MNALIPAKLDLFAALAKAKDEIVKCVVGLMVAQTGLLPGVLKMHD